MRFSKYIFFVGLVLCCVLFSGGCSQINNLFGGSGESETAKNNEEQTEQPPHKEQLEKEKQEKEKQIDELKTKLELNLPKAKDERKKCDEMTADTKQAGKNPESEKDAPKTLAQCQKASEIENSISLNQASLSKELKELKDIDKKINAPTVEKSDDTGNKNEDSWLPFLLIGLAGLAGLAGIGILYYFLTKKIDNSLIREQKSRLRELDSIKAGQSEANSKIRQLTETAQLQGNHIKQLEVAIQNLQKSNAENSGQNYQQQPIFSPPPQPPEPEFPVLAEDYLNKVRANSRTATADVMSGLLVNDESKGDEFLIVNDDTLGNDLYYAVPNQIRFNAKSDYLNYYLNFYAFDNPSGGAVWIKSPTVVKQVAGGWELESMGELEVR